MITTPRTLFKAVTRKRIDVGPAISVRVPDDLLRRLAAYGNSKGLSMSDSVRAVLELGLDAA